MQEETYPFVVKPLPYEYDALCPVLDAATMTVHHDRHYKAYVDQLNETLSDYPELQKSSLPELLKYIDRLPTAIQKSVRNNGGGVYNHQLYFDSMKSPAGQEVCGALAEALERDFGAKQWKEKMKQAAVSQFGSGWAWLVTDRNGILSIMQTANQDTPDLKELTPILLVDVWEHAYYLQYKNLRSSYVDGWFRLINWKKAAKRYENRLS